MPRANQFTVLNQPEKKRGRANNPVPPSQIQTLTLEAVLNQIEKDFAESLKNVRFRLAALKTMMG